MSNRQYITTTNLDEYRALVWQGTQAFVSSEQLHRLLTSRLSPEHSALFAAPLPDDVRHQADWYYIGSNEYSDPASQTGQPVRLIDLPPEAQAPIREKLLTLGNDIYNLAQELKNSSDSNQQTAGNLLEMMLTFPGEEFIYVLGNTPVLIVWGFTSDTGNAPPETLTRIRTVLLEAPLVTPPDASTIQTPFDEQMRPEKKVRSFAWLWTLLAFLIGIIICGLLLYFLGPQLGAIGFSGCSREATPSDESVFGFSGCTRENVPENVPENDAPEHDAPSSDGSVFGFSGCTREVTPPEGPNQELLQAQLLEDSLRAELERLHQELLSRLAECEQEPLPEQQEEPFVEPPIEPLLEEEIPEEPVPPMPELSLPDIPDNLPEDLPEDIIDEPIDELAEDNNMEIPDQPENMEFLEGCWDAPTGLVNVDDNQPVIVEYCFDENGKGTVRISELDKNGNPRFTCEGPAQAQLQGNQLLIDDNGAICPDDSKYRGNQLICYKDEKNRTVCKGSSKGRSKNEWGPVPFRESQE